MPQPIQSAENYFTVLGAPSNFRQDRAALERRFYEISRALHPDRFSTSKLEAKTLSISRMSLVNQAYSVLKSPAALRDYLLKQEGISISGKAAMPAELAEAWFEIQDLRMEDPELAQKKLSEFEGELVHLKTEIDGRLQELENKFDSQHDRSVLESLAHELQTQSYLNSIQRDIERIKKNAHSN